MILLKAMWDLPICRIKCIGNLLKKDLNLLLWLLVIRVNFDIEFLEDLITNYHIILFLGESGLGKSTLINSLFLTDLYPERVVSNPSGIIF